MKQFHFIIQFIIQHKNIAMRAILKANRFKSKKIYYRSIINQLDIEQKIKETVLQLVFKIKHSNKLT